VINNILQTITSATFLLLASLLIYDRWDNNNSTANVEALRKELQDQNLKNVYYLESRQNAISSRQDDYQVNVNNRISVLENRMISLAKNSKPNKSVISNTNSVTFQTRSPEEITKP
jgi:hypothetical protein